MLARLRRTVSVFAIVVVLYVAYSLVVVPFVEPNVKFAAKKGAPPPPAARMRKLDHLFPAGAWELSPTTMVVETDQGTLLFENYKPQKNGLLELTKCTLLASVDDSSSKSQEQPDGKAERRQIIIRAMNGATLNFGQEFDVQRFEYGPLRGGQLNGEVTIFSPPTNSSTDDTLELVTKNIQIDQGRIWTPHEVRFRYGPNSGRGHVLTIRLTKPSKSKDANSGLGISGVHSVELERLDAMELLLHNDGLFGQQKSKPQATSQPRQAAVVQKNPATPVQVKCSGVVSFDAAQQLIVLNDKVELARIHPSGLVDQLNCQRLEIHFTEGKSAAALAETGTRVSNHNMKLTPTRVVATGRPVTIRAASMGIGTRAERIEYDCVLQRVWLQDRDKVLLNDSQREVEALELRYTLGEGNRIGDLWAQGPGIVRGKFGKELRSFEVAWQDEVQLQRVNQEPVLFFNESVHVTVADVGSFVGDAVHLYLRETIQGETDRVETAPDRLHAVGHVEVDSQKCHAQLQELKVWFKSPDSAAPRPATNRPPQQNLFPSYNVAGPAQPASKFELRAGLVEAIVLMHDDPVVDLLIVRDRLELTELTSSDLEPLTIHGDFFQLQQGASDQPKAALLGSPAEILARGMWARGEKIYLYPLDNSLKIVGAGEMRPPAARASNISTNAAPPVSIEWTGNMQFDGLLARFEDNVTVRGSQRPANGGLTTFVATGDVVHAELTKRIEFQNPKAAGKVDVMEVAFDGWGFLQTEMLDQNGERKLFEQMQVLGLAVNHQTGDLHGSGPGWLRGIHHGKDLAPSGGGPGLVPVSKSGLSFIRVDFQREIVGNLKQQRIEFLNGTKTLYGPVETWDDALDQEQIALPPGTFHLTCDRLAVSQFGEGGDSVELEAVGNAHIQGDTVDATGGRVSYVRLKDQLILEGDGRNDAQVEYRTQPGAPLNHFAAGKIMYWPKSGLVKVMEVKQSEFDVGQLRGRGAPAIKPLR